MKEVVPPPAPGENEQATITWRTVFKPVTATAKVLAIGATEWLPSLIDQPTEPPFIHNAPFQNEFQRSARLIVFTLFVSGIVIGGFELYDKTQILTDTLRDAFGLFVTTIIIALVYKPFSYLTGVRICPEKGSPEDDVARPPLSMRQVTFSVLYTFVPWLPVLAFIASTVVLLRGALLDFFLVAPFICFAYINYNFYKAIRVVTNCSKPRIMASLILPLGLSLLYIVWTSLI